MAATKPAFNPPGKKGDMIFSALVKLAALIVLLLLGGIIVSLIFSSWPSIQKFGFSFLWTKEWDAPNDIYGALVSTHLKKISRTVISNKKINQNYIVK